MISLGIKKLFVDVNPPLRQTAGSAGNDVEAYCPEDITIKPGECILIPTGFQMEIPSGYDVEIRPRSGLSTKHLLILPNSPGTIDSDYRGEVKVALLNLSQKPFVVSHKMRIAQLILRKNEAFDWEIKEALSEPEQRGTGGFGSTGI